MNCHEPLPFGEFEIDDRCHDLDAGVADEDVKASKCRDDLGRSTVHLLLICDVHRDADNLLASGIDLARSGIGCFLIKICDSDLCAFAQEDDGNFLSDAAGRTRNDCNFVS